MKKENSFLEIINVDLEEYKGKKLRDEGMVNWLEQGMRELQKKEEEKKPKRLNIASLGVLTRRIMAQEWAKIRGRRLPHTYILALEQEIMHRKEKINGRRG
jgi:hypothetical protein